MEGGKMTPLRTLLLIAAFLVFTLGTFVTYVLRAQGTAAALSPSPAAMTIPVTGATT
jgi:hypothetical protein